MSISAEAPPPPVASSPKALLVIALLSVAVPAAVALLLLTPHSGEVVSGGGAGPLPRAVTLVPAVNAVLNSLTAVALLVGYACIRGGRIRAHRASMLTAFTLSSVFLVLYVVYHAFPQTREAHFGGVGWVRPVYFTILISHIALAAITVPFVLTALYFALTGQFARHKAVTRWTFPIWLYVAVTGVVAYLMIAPYYPWNQGR